MSLAVDSTPSRNLFQVAGVFFCVALALTFSPNGHCAPDPCITGFPPPEKAASVSAAYEEALAEALIQPQVRRWLTEHHWQAGYELWQASRLCRGRFGPSANDWICEQPPVPLPEEDLCQGEQDGYAFLAMHRYLLQSVRALWPQLDAPFSGWAQFPAVADYPVFLRPRFQAWPNGLLAQVPSLGSSARKAGHGMPVEEDADSASRREQLLARWKSEGELGQWLQCGGTRGGLAVNGLYGALITNAVSVGNALSAHQRSEVSLMDLYLFWKTHGWIDKVWEDYRQALGKTPDDPRLQAALIQQCRIHQAWVEKARALPAPKPAQESPSPLYVQGEFNRERAGSVAWVLGELVEIRRGPNERTFLKVDARLAGVKPLWVASHTPLDLESLRPGRPYTFVGTVALADALDNSGQLRAFLQSPTLLLLQSFQSPK